MNTRNNPLVEIEEREIVFTRILNAPRALVFEVWTDPKHVAKWWGPNGFTNTIHEMDVRPSGVWRFIMHGPDGIDYPNKIVYKEVLKPERLVYSHGGDDENDPGQFQVTVTFDDQGNKTELTMRMLFVSKEERDKVVKEYGAVEGGNQTLNRLEEHLAKM
ncbi:MAG: ATPase [Bacilli bacterium]|nr:ATPase [Bacilli bacterium]